MSPDSNRFLQFLFKIRWLLGFLCVLGLVFSVDYLFLHILLPIKRQNLKPTFDLPPNSVISSPLTISKGSKSQLGTLANCLADSPFGPDSTKSPKDFLEKALKHPLMIENYKSFDGFKIADDDGNYDFTIYFANKENQPPRYSLYKNGTNGKRVTVEIKGDPSKYLEGKKILTRNTEMQATFSNGWTLTYYLKDKELSSFLLKMGPKTIACNGTTCFCK